MKDRSTGIAYDDLVKRHYKPKFYSFILFYLFLSFDSQESDGGANTWGKQLP